MRRLGSVVPVALAAAAALVACADILGIQDLSNQRPGSDAAPPVDAGPDVDPRCAADPGPPPPDGGDGPSQPDLLLALDSIDFGKISDMPGINLDHACTVDRNAGSCVSPSAVSSGFVDQPGGGDNAAFQAFTTGGDGGYLASELIGGLQNGSWTLLLRVRDYDGTADDPSVVVQVATGFARSGTSWSVDGVSVDGGLDGALTSASAWVTGGVLLARFDDLPIVSRTSLGTFVVRLRGAVITGKLDAKPTLTGGVVAGRWLVSDALLELGRLKGAFCIGSALSQIFCSARDILGDAGDDGKRIECDSVSAAFGFTAAAATFADPPADGGGLSPKICAGAFTQVCP